MKSGRLAMHAPFVMSPVLRGKNNNQHSPLIYSGLKQRYYKKNSEKKTEIEKKRKAKRRRKIDMSQDGVLFHHLLCTFVEQPLWRVLPRPSGLQEPRKHTKAKQGVGLHQLGRFSITSRGGNLKEGLDFVELAILPTGVRPAVSLVGSSNGWLAWVSIVSG